MSLVAKQAIICWIVALALSIAVLFAFIGAPHSAGGAGEAIGRVFAHTGIAAFLCWFAARRENTGVVMDALRARLLRAGRRTRRRCGRRARASRMTIGEQAHACIDVGAGVSCAAVTSPE